jgi:hypothetical protein
MCASQQRQQVYTLIMHKKNMRFHALLCSCPYMLYSCRHTLKHTLMHALPCRNQCEHTPSSHHTHIRASPCSNHSEHAPCTSPDTHSHTCKHRLAAITVSMRLVQAQTHTPTHACIASQQSQGACALYEPKHTLRHMRFVCVTKMNRNVRLFHATNLLIIYGLAIEIVSITSFTHRYAITCIIHTRIL